MNLHTVSELSKKHRTAPESIHLCDFPFANEAHIDAQLEKNMEEGFEKEWNINGEDVVLAVEKR